MKEEFQNVVLQSMAITICITHVSGSTFFVIIVVTVIIFKNFII